jgi:hypothetical protein
MADLDLPPHLLAEIESGNLVLMLGAGASLSATNDKGQHPPRASELAESIAKRFLPSGFEHMPLNQVAEYAINESDLFTVQDFLADCFRPFHETATHRLLSTFRWRGIATTNYDLLIEEGYRKEPKAVQRLIPVIDNTDRFDEKVRDHNDLLLLKLHGCNTRTKNNTCPLILSTDQYVSYMKGRNKVFAKFKEWASERSVLFIGYGLQDQSLRQIIQEIDDEIPSRPRYYFISPAIKDIDKRLWENKHITAIAATFDDVFETLDKRVAVTFRGLLPTTDVGNAGIKHRFVKRDAAMSKNAAQFLENDVDYVNGIGAIETVEPKLFYKGAVSGWGAIEQELDVRRHVMDTILVDHFLGEVDTAEPNLKLLVVLAHAGAGKSVLLRRTAWEAARVYNRLCLFLRPEGIINPAAMREIAELAGEPLFLFVESLLDRRREVEHLLSNAASLKGRITIISAARTNEWNQAPDAFTALATEEYELPYLSKTEIDELLRLLEKNKALGKLQELTPQQREEQLRERAGRQLLVALHEATFGKPFELIISDEYKHITPDKAQQIYLTVCMLNQYGVPVRAGIISRMYGIPFEEFRRSFFAPLEEIIITRIDRISGDYCYSARHSHIAEMVVRSELKSKEELFNRIVTTMQYLNPSFKSDDVAFRKLIQGRSLLDQFPNHEMVVQIYDTARKVAGEEAFLFQQMAIYEMNRDNGSLAQAEKWVRKAVELSRNSRSIKHTLAELFVRRAESTNLSLEKEKYLSEAAEICQELKGKMQEAYPFYTLVKIGTIRIREALRTGTVHDQTLEALIRNVEKELTDGKLRYEDNAYLRSAESELAKTLAESDRAIKSLSKAFELNPRNPFIAMRLAEYWVGKGGVEEGTKILKKALECKRGDNKLNYAYAKLLLEQRKGTDEEVLYHLERAYVSGDENYEAQFLHARQLFKMNKAVESKDLFRKLSRAHIAPSAKKAVRYPLDGTFIGTIDRMEDSFCWIKRDGDGEYIHVSRERVGQHDWNSLSYGTRGSFRIGFTMKGAAAFDLIRE